MSFYSLQDHHGPNSTSTRSCFLRCLHHTGLFILFIWSQVRSIVKTKDNIHTYAQEIKCKIHHRRTHKIHVASYMTRKDTCPPSTLILLQEHRRLTLSSRTLQQTGYIYEYSNVFEYLIY